MEHVNEIYAFCQKASPGLRVDDEGGAPGWVEDRAETAAVLREAVEALILLISPFTPHLAEELWERLGHEGGVVAAGWPAFDSGAAAEESLEIPVQVNGKVRGRVTVPAGSSEDEIRAAAFSAPSVTPHLAGMDVVKVVVPNGRLVSIVVRPRT
jgi:leucyl-tRNA synthetase